MEIRGGGQAMSFAPSEYLDLSQTEHSALFDDVVHVWEVLDRIASYLQSKLKPGMHGKPIGHPVIGADVFVGEGTLIEPGAYIAGPAWIGKNCRIGHGAYIREHVIVGDGCVLGNSSEFKNCLLLNGAKAPHYNYVGDSVLGHKAHLGAGVILSNYRLDGADIHVRHQDETISTHRRKFGAVVGDGAEVGCQSVINPGSLLGRGSMVYPLTNWQGVLAAGARARMPQAFGVSMGG
jgi:UDP-N-acetylglucosamine diphosphorylase / glucose-1-phosphate thymidylyltransferase / UDP-N-acetylgalactosamine diphosphorylase / glucosamine-1-phosphate N-acetyltransferase / galactosamine-1-phosphate N-acetyltransferase